jgi:hypothetical protein
LHLESELGRKIYLMMQAAFDGRPPQCVRARHENAVIYMESNDPGWTIPPTLIAESDFEDVTAKYADPKLVADVSTDNLAVVLHAAPRVSRIVSMDDCPDPGPFRVADREFLRAEAAIQPYAVLLSGCSVHAGGDQGGHGTFGSTWQIIGLVIASMLVMAFLANVAVDRLMISRPYLAYVILCACLLLGWAVARSGGLPSTTMGRLGTAILLTSPLFFSGIVFSSLLQSDKGLHGAMAMNILRALCGGLLAS